MSKTTIPESLLAKLFDATGTSTGGNKGFLLVAVNSNGDPTVTSRSENSCVHFALKKAVEMLIKSEKNQMPL